MKKLILFLLTATLLILPLSGCFADNKQNEGTTPANTTENTTPEETTPESTEPNYTPLPDETTSEVTTPEITSLDDPLETTTPEVTTPDNPAIDIPNYERSEELDEIFTWLEEVEAENDRILFYIWYEGVEQEYKNKGSHDNYGWTKSFFEVYVCCDYQMAVNEPWYPKDSQPNRKTLNSAFYNSCKDKFTDGAYTENSIYEALRFTYDTPEQLLADYEALTSLLNLPYVTAIAIHYNFPLPVGVA